MLNVEGLSVCYGPICAVRKIDLQVRPGEIVALIGANGAGKSTLINAVLGLQRAKSGTITFLGQDITRWKTEKVVAAGISVVRRWVETLVPCPYSLLERLKSETAAWGGVIPETE